jgi:hypothetical protein
MTTATVNLLGMLKAKLPADANVQLFQPFHQSFVLLGPIRAHTESYSREPVGVVVAESCSLLNAY